MFAENKSNRFTAVVPTKNREKDLLRFCEGLAAQTLLPDKLIIVDQSAEKYRMEGINLPESVDVEHLYAPEVSGLCAAKNLAVRYAAGEYIFFFDDDIIPDKDFFEKIIGHFSGKPRNIRDLRAAEKQHFFPIQSVFFRFFPRRPL